MRQTTQSCFQMVKSTAFKVFSQLKSQVATSVPWRRSGSSKRIVKKSICPDMEPIIITYILHMLIIHVFESNISVNGVFSDCEILNAESRCTGLHFWEPWALQISNPWSCLEIVTGVCWSSSYPHRSLLWYLHTLLFSFWEKQIILWTPCYWSIFSFLLFILLNKLLCVKLTRKRVLNIVQNKRLSFFSPVWLLTTVVLKIKNWFFTTFLITLKTKLLYLFAFISRKVCWMFWTLIRF